MSVQQVIQEEVRGLYSIAADIDRCWKNVYFGARPYIDAMHTMNSIHDKYGLDSGESIVAYFLSNASTFRGADARRIKKELKSILATL